ncbi:hypothetical protein BDZ89DRAFT_477401 [Hymenopellis radicata]|nr:hypothetical protein BDZ89DRAFT_477401 [Hymenopellis radicata]
MRDLDFLGTYWLGAPVMTAIISCIVQFFYAWRIWVLTKKYWIPGIIMLVSGKYHFRYHSLDGVQLSLVQSVAGVYAGDWAKRINHFSEIQSETYVVTSIWLAGTALCDTLIAVSMSWTLLRARTGVRTTDALVVGIVQLSVETGTLCAAFALLDLIFYLIFKHNNFHMIPSIALTKMYSNSYFAVLNSRVRITGGRMSEVVSTDPTLSVCVAMPGQSNTLVRFRGTATSYATTTDVELAHTSTDAQTESGMPRVSADDFNTLEPRSIQIESNNSSPV